MNKEDLIIKQDIEKINSLVLELNELTKDELETEQISERLKIDMIRSLRKIRKGYFNELRGIKDENI